MNHTGGDPTQALLLWANEEEQSRGRGAITGPSPARKQTAGLGPIQPSAFVVAGPSEAHEKKETRGKKGRERKAQQADSPQAPSLPSRLPPCLLGSREDAAGQVEKEREKGPQAGVPSSGRRDHRKLEEEREASSDPSGRGGILLSDFVLADTKEESFIGKGSFGVVLRVRLKGTDHEFAMKTIQTDAVGFPELARQIETEVAVQMGLSHENLLGLHAFFLEDTRLFLLIELCEKGEMYKLLRMQPLRRFSEETAYFLWMQALAGINHMHLSGFMHRDIKPENLLVAAGDIVKVCDFGWATQICGKRKKRTFCGTLDYLSPEMLRGEGHDHTSDLWQMGVLLFEFLDGKPAFQSTSHSNLFNKILSNQLAFPKHFSEEARDLISRLLKERPAERISVEEIVTHPWVLKFKDSVRLPEGTRRSLFGLDSEEKETGEGKVKGEQEQEEGAWVCEEEDEETGFVIVEGRGAREGTGSGKVESSQQTGPSELKKTELIVDGATSAFFDHSASSLPIATATGDDSADVPLKVPPNVPFVSRPPCLHPQTGHSHGVGLGYGHTLRRSKTSEPRPVYDDPALSPGRRKPAGASTHRAGRVPSQDPPSLVTPPIQGLGSQRGDTSHRTHSAPVHAKDSFLAKEENSASNLPVMCEAERERGLRRLPGETPGETSEAPSGSSGRYTPSSFDPHPNGKINNLNPVLPHPPLQGPSVAAAHKVLSLQQEQKQQAFAPYGPGSGGSPVPPSGSLLARSSMEARQHMNLHPNMHPQLLHYQHQSHAPFATNPTPPLTHRQGAHHQAYSMARHPHQHAGPSPLPSVASPFMPAMSPQFALPSPHHPLSPHAQSLVAQPAGIPPSVHPHAHAPHALHQHAGIPKGPFYAPPAHHHPQQQPIRNTDPAAEPATTQSAVQTPAESRSKLSSVRGGSAAVGTLKRAPAAVGTLKRAPASATEKEKKETRVPITTSTRRKPSAPKPLNQPAASRLSDRKAAGGTGTKPVSPPHPDVSKSPTAEKRRAARGGGIPSQSPPSPKSPTSRSRGATVTSPPPTSSNKVGGASAALARKEKERAVAAAGTSKTRGANVFPQKTKPKGRNTPGVAQAPQRPAVPSVEKETRQHHRHQQTPIIPHGRTGTPLRDPHPNSKINLVLPYPPLQGPSIAAAHKVLSLQQEQKQKQQASAPYGPGSGGSPVPPSGSLLAHSSMEARQHMNLHPNMHPPLLHYQHQPPAPFATNPTPPLTHRQGAHHQAHSMARHPHQHAGPSPHRGAGMHQRVLAGASGARAGGAGGGRVGVGGGGMKPAKNALPVPPHQAPVFRAQSPAHHAVRGGATSPSSSAAVGGIAWPRGAFGRGRQGTSSFPLPSKSPWATVRVPNIRQLPVVGLLQEMLVLAPSPLTPPEEAGAKFFHMRENALREAILQKTATSKQQRKERKGDLNRSAIFAVFEDLIFGDSRLYPNEAESPLQTFDSNFNFLYGFGHVSGDLKHVASKVDPVRGKLNDKSTKVFGLTWNGNLYTEKVMQTTDG
uniref:Protein kinase domain-containing protein n=1 Tax=Chromera velia CCMP2878 TaxID=1169474 RepID=A0A0G4F096_9ALVE|eukprot:Cvel_14363.t1-p1 / transcript=Cvel_14363.t1 / gene=Cvel_14363 / organism=Chromera_velia_CCMP2878 / gene_product=Serine/threonine-protein kinase ark1, putative / transcript_product=Serine/threonine-protein kinase ark1, putative / location=Cvel_scaffold1019:9394-26549(+) / protein_length=1511 / sequence_SO=supercontig / SO=protein_coding / is_pseudo=false